MTDIIVDPDAPVSLESDVEAVLDGPPLPDPADSVVGPVDPDQPDPAPDHDQPDLPDPDTTDPDIPVIAEKLAVIDPDPKVKPVKSAKLKITLDVCPNEDCQSVFTTTELDGEPKRLPAEHNLVYHYEICSVCGTRLGDV